MFHGWAIRIAAGRSQTPNFFQTFIFFKLSKSLNFPFSSNFKECQLLLSFPEHFGEIPAKFHQNFAEKSQNSSKNAKKIQKITNFGKNLDGFSLKFWDLSGAKVWKSCRSRKTWKNEYLVAIVAVDTAENEPLKVWGWLGQTQTPNSAKKFELLSAAQKWSYLRDLKRQ